VLVIDGAMGEGGGQVLRTALALSLCRQLPFQMVNIRAHRQKPGLQPQHLAAVQAAARISAARVDNASLGSQRLSFQPNGVHAGDYCFNIGTAGSATLLVQTILPALMLAKTPSSLRVEGGTHNPLSPPFEFFVHAFCGLLTRMGVTLEAKLERPGFFPKGGGIMQVRLQPAHSLQPLHLLQRGALQQVSAHILLAHLPEHIAQRERKVLCQALALADEDVMLHNADVAFGPGNTVSVFVRSEHVTEVFTGFGQRGVRAESVAHDVVAQVNAYLQAQVPVGRYLADQLLIPLALTGSGEYLTQEPSLHTTTNMAVISRFTGAHFSCEAINPRQWRIALGD
jgi:RNA 3'-terminal phosphate cyclase (ATP)